MEQVWLIFIRKFLHRFEILQTEPLLLVTSMSRILILNKHLLNVLITLQIILQIFHDAELTEKRS